MLCWPSKRPENTIPVLEPFSRGAASIFELLVVQASWCWLERSWRARGAKPRFSKGFALICPVGRSAGTALRGYYVTLKSPLALFLPIYKRIMWLRKADHGHSIPTITLRNFWKLLYEENPSRRFVHQEKLDPWAHDPRNCPKGIKAL